MKSKLCYFTGQVDGEGRSFRLLGDVDDFLETRNTKSYVFSGHSREMESVKGHLSGGFSDTLCSQRSTHLTWGLLYMGMRSRHVTQKRDQTRVFIRNVFK